jgi:hypothetical protein
MKKLSAILVLSGCLLAPMVTAAQVPGVQLPGVGTLSVTSKTQLMDQAKQMVQDLTSMKTSGKLSADQVGKVDALLPKANALNAELAKPEIETNKLTQLAKDLGDLQKQVGVLKALVQ